MAESGTKKQLPAGWAKLGFELREQKIYDPPLKLRYTRKSDLYDIDSEEYYQVLSSGLYALPAHYICSECKGFFVNCEIRKEDGTKTRFHVPEEVLEGKAVEYVLLTCNCKLEPVKS